MDALYSQLNSLFGFRSFRAHQEGVVRAILDGRDSFTVMPTGGGKSLCYQLPAKLLPGVCVVVSPLISLMKDQVDAARATGLAAASYNSACTGQERNAAMGALFREELDLLYISPERLRLGDFTAMLRERRIAFFAIDEAHCISEWGHDFRPDYLALADLAELFPGVPVAAFTATATHRVADDIIKRLNLRDPVCTRASFDRPNLFYQISPKGDLDKQLLDFVREREGESGIIYRTTRKNVEATTAFLKRKGIEAVPYHAGLADTERAAAQNAFRDDACQVIVATIAFGMGIDKSNVRYVVHGDLPKNMEGYYQETGRAGRDGEPARCALFYGRQDIARLMGFAEGIEDESARQTAREQLFRMLDFTQKEGCRRKALLAYFGEEYPRDNCHACDICAGEVEREDATIDAQKLLSAMVRTGNRFGARHLIFIVLGKESKRIRDFGHQSLPTFGVGKDRDEAHWRAVMDTLLAQGLARVSDPSLPVPAITGAGWEVLRGQRSCAMIRRAAKAGRASKAIVDSPLFEALRQERRELAKEAGVPPYVVFSDRTLREMAAKRPADKAAFLALTGVGEHKLAAYGDHFLHFLRDWQERYPQDAAPEPEADPAAAQDDATGPDHTALEPGVDSPPKKSGRAQRGDTWRETARLLDSGLSLEAVAAERGLKPSSILRHLAELVASGREYSPERFMTPERMAYIHSLFAACAATGPALGQVVELARQQKAEGSTDQPPVSYHEASLARIYLPDSPDRPDSPAIAQVPGSVG